MKLEQQVCSLELAKRLKGLGVKQESLFWWVKVKHDGEHFVKMEGTIAYWEAKRLGFDDIYSAFTVAELGEMLPAGIVQTDKCKKETDLKEWALYLAGSKHHVFSDNEADARAKMLIYLIENKLQTIKEGK